MPVDLKVGDTVRILGIVADLHRDDKMPSPHPGIVSDMVAMVGKKFPITKVEVNGKLYEIDGWAFLREWIEVASDGPAPTFTPEEPKELMSMEMCRKLAQHLYDQEWVDIIEENDEGDNRLKIMDFLAESIYGFVSSHSGVEQSSQVQP